MSWFTDVVSRGDERRAEELLARGYVLHFPGLPPLDAAGHLQLLATFRRGFPDWSETVDDVVAEGDRVVMTVTGRGRHDGEFQGIAPTHALVEVTGVGIARFADGQITESWAQFDALGLMQQLGAMPAGTHQRDVPSPSRPPSAAASSPDTVQANKEVIRRYWADASARGVDAITEDVFDADVVSHPPRSICPLPLQGLDAFRTFSSGGFFGAFPDLSVEIHELAGEGDRVAARVTARGTHTGEMIGIAPTGRPVEIGGIELFRFVGGRIVEQWGWPDTLGLLQQLGLDESAAKRMPT